MNVNFIYNTGLAGNLFRNVRLVGSWDAEGNYSDQWTSRTMDTIVSGDNSLCFKTTVELKKYGNGNLFRWGVLLDGPGGPNQWGITTEVNSRNSRDRYREFELKEANQTEEYYLTHCRRLGANKLLLGTAREPAISFSVWAPNAKSVEMVRGNADSGYIADNDKGAVSRSGDFPLFKDPKTGIWKTDVKKSPALSDYRKFDHTPYMYRITKDDGTVAYRTDLYSRCQNGRGSFDPVGKPYFGTLDILDGSVSCSVVVDPEQVTRDFSSEFGREVFVSDKEFWAEEFDPRRPLPNRAEDLVIYELHVGGLDSGKKDKNCNSSVGTLREAIDHLDYLVDLGINAIELLPMNEFEGWVSWGYGTSHFFAVEYSGGGRDQYKHFVRECHRRGIAVIQDVVYNHYDHDAERAEWMYDTNTHEKNIYYWYEGKPSDYPDYEIVSARKAAEHPNNKDNPSPGHGGYIDNMSTAYAPRYNEEMVRKMFISSAVVLAYEFHVDGFRVDQTTSIHKYAVLHANGSAADDACIFGAKFLRELTLTLRLVKPDIFLLAEDHSGWPGVTEPVIIGGLGFDATWYADFYHHLIGDTEKDPSYAKLIKTAGLGDNRPLAMDYFKNALSNTSNHTVVYHESHDEAGNSRGTGRTIVIAANRAPLCGDTRRYAEARCRVACGLTLFSGGIPMFFMGEEVGFQKDYTYNNFINQRENFPVARNGPGAGLFRFYQDVIRFRHANSALKSPFIDITYVHNTNRIIAFKRWYGHEEFFVIASLNDNPFVQGYGITNSRISDGMWREVFNSDSTAYGGVNIGNGGNVLSVKNGYINIILPANALVIFQKVTS